MTQKLAEPGYGLAEEARTPVLGCMSAMPYKPVANAYTSFPSSLNRDYWMLHTPRIPEGQTPQQARLAFWRIML